MNLSKKVCLNNSILNQLRYQLEILEIHDYKLAKLLCKIIPSNCPFAKPVTINGHTLFQIPPLCKLNPLYEQLMTLRYKCLLYLVDQCGEDATKYC
ncbi:Mo-dependent nitrogenase family protein [Nostoc sp. NIES-4103]|nr:Mo-dependent nitrogenase family protein [Nostoc sp. NIES-4103]